MKEIIFLTLIIISICNNKNSPLITQDLITELDNTLKLWQHTTYEENIFKNWTIQKFESILSNKMIESPTYKKYVDLDTQYTSKNFDARTKWSECAFTIRNDLGCAAVSVFATTEVLQDRLCITHDIHELLGIQYQIDCDDENYQCQGGYISKAFEFLYNTGTVSESCDPYLAKYTGRCPASCKDRKPMVHYKCKTPEFQIISIPIMQSTIEKYGPLVTSFSIYTDFGTYKSGIYHHTSGYYRGGHIVKVIGFGVLDGVKYWLVANSWGVHWGMEGYFMIQQGDCGIDAVMSGCGDSA